MTTQTSETQAVDYAVETGVLIRTAMFRQGMTITTLAQRVGLSQPTMSQKLRGQTQITVPELMTMAGALGVDPGQLLPRLDSNQQPSGYQSVQVREAVVLAFPKRAA